MKFRRSHNFTVEEAKIHADEIADDLCQRFGLTSQWRDDSLYLSGTGVKGELHLEEHVLEIVIELGLALKLMEGPIRNVVEHSLDEHL